MQGLENLGLGDAIILGMLAGILLGATLSLGRKFMAARQSGIGFLDYLRKQGVFWFMLIVLWFLLIFYAVVIVMAPAQ